MGQEYMQTSGLPSIQGQKRLTSGFLKAHLEKIKVELKIAGADKYDLALPETNYLASVIHPDENILGSVYGKYTNGRGALFITDQRILFIDKKPMFVDCREISFDVISGISRTNIGPIGTVTLYTKLGELKLRTLNQKNAINFVNSVDRVCLNKSTHV